MRRALARLFVHPLAALLMALPLAAAAQRIEALTVQPASAKAGQPVAITAQFDISQGLNCNARVQFGDGRSQEFKVNQDKDASYRLSHVYEQPGTYTVTVEGKTALPVLRCVGDAARATVTITR